MNQVLLYILCMIRTFRHKGLKELFERGATRRVDSQLIRRCHEALTLINAAQDLKELNIAGWRLHQLKQYDPVRYSIWITGAWRITFEWSKGGADRVDLEQYH